MLIAQVCPRYHPYIGGVEVHVQEISERLLKDGFEVEVLTTDPCRKLPKEEIVNGVHVKRFKAYAPNEAYYFSRELKVYLTNNSGSYDIVHAHSYHAFPALYAAQAKDRNKLIFTPHSHGKGHTFFRNLLHIPYKFLARKIYEKADRICCVSAYEKSLVMNSFKVKEEEISVIPNGVNLEEFKGLQKRKKDCRAILYVGRLEEYKGIDFLVKVLPRLDSNTCLEIVGKGPYKKSLVKLVDRLGIRSKVSFYQNLPRNELLQKYADADLFVLLSRYEASGISVAEALAAGTPCIVANTGALREWIDDKSCFGVDHPINVDDLVKLIDKVGGIRVRREGLIDWNENVKNLENVYRETLGDPL